MAKQFHLGLAVGLIIGTTLAGAAFSILSNKDKTDSTPYPPIAISGAPQPLSNLQPINKKHIDKAIPTSKQPQEEKVPSSSSHRSSHQEILCDNSCSLDILNKFLSDELLSHKEIELMTQNSSEIAQRVSQDPTLLSDLQTIVAKGVDTQSQFALLRVIYHLPSEQALSFVDQLNDGSDNDRINSIELLSMLSNGQDHFSKKIENTLQTEINPHVIAASIDALNTISPQTISETTLNTISSLLINTENQTVKGKAIEALSQRQHFDQNVEQYLYEGLRSSSKDLQLSSMHALRNVLRAEKTGQVSPAMREQIKSIANNTGLPEDLRIEALSIMNLYTQSNSY